MAMTSIFGRRVLAEARAKRTRTTTREVTGANLDDPLGRQVGLASDSPEYLLQDLSLKGAQPTKLVEGAEPNLLMPFEYETPRITHRDKRVVVVGGGLAGLIAGWMLATQGLDVMVLEARGKVGGRVNTQGTGARLLEVGGELIGAIHTRWIKLAKHFNLGLSPISTEVMYARQGLELPLRVNNRHGQREIKPGQWNLDEAYASLNAHANQVDPFAPWDCKFADAWDNMSVQEWIDELKSKGKISKDTATLLAYELSTNQATPISKQSYLGLLAATRAGSYKLLNENEQEMEPSPYWGDDCETFRCSSGNQRLAVEMARACRQAGGKVQTLEAATRIEQTPAGWTISTHSWQRERRGSKRRPKKRKYQADWIILAIPPAVFRKVKFAPPELAQFIRRLQRFQTGPAVKYFAPVKDRFWLSQNLAPAAQDTGLGIVWENTDSQNVQKTRPKSLTVFIGGDLAKSSRWKSGRDKYFLNHLDTIFSGFKSNVDRRGCDIAEWPKFEWTQCGYSCPGVGQVNTLSKAFAQHAENLTFAGEHTSIAFFGFMEGALESGLRAANQIFKGMGIKLTPKLRINVPK